MRANRFLFILFLTSILLAPNCATLTRRSTQTIPVTSSPAGATVTVNGAQQGVTPLDLRLARKDKNQVIRIEYPGYNPLEIRMRRSYSTPHALVNGVLGGITGLWIAFMIDVRDETASGTTLLWTIPAAIGAFFLADVISHAGYNLNPSDLIVTLSKAEGPPRVDTVLIDAEDFQNIKWIRVRRD